MWNWCFKYLNETLSNAILKFLGKEYDICINLTLDIHFIKQILINSSSAEPKGCIKKRIGNEWTFVKVVGIIDIKQEILKLKKQKAKHEKAIIDIQKKLEGKAAEKMAEEAKIENEQKLEKNKHDIL